MFATIETLRLRLVPVTATLAGAELGGRESLSRAIGTPIAPDWPPEHWDEAVLRWILDAVASPQFDPRWPGFYILLREPGRGLLIGTAGFKSAPDEHGVVEIGYGVVNSHQRRGLASEAVRGMLQYAWAHPNVRRVDAETFPHLAPSLGVMRTCGMSFIGPGHESGTVRYGISRPVG